MQFPPLKGPAAAARKALEQHAGRYNRVLDLGTLLLPRLCSWLEHLRPAAFRKSFR